MSFRTSLAHLVAIDLLFIALYLIAIRAERLDLIDQVPTTLRIARDGALPETYNYLIWVIIVLALACMAIRERWLAPMVWAMVFAWILADDSLQLHEGLGDFFAALFGFTSNDFIEADDIGEILAFALIGFLVFALTAALFRRKDARSRALSLRYAGIILGLAFFGVGIDFAHSIASLMSRGSSLAGLTDLLFIILEEGGEMIVGSLAVALTLAGSRAATRIPGDG